MKKCSMDEHKKNPAISYCPKCKIHMCNRCQNLHSELFKAHIILHLDKSFDDIFTGICNEENHENKLEFFCKNHNVLCCLGCISKIKNNIYGQHTDCEIYNIEDIQEEKKDKLKENINNLENLSDSIEQYVEDLKKIFEKVNENRENTKLKIQKIFTKIRNVINDRETELLFEVDEQLNKLFFDENFVKKGEKLPTDIKKSLKKGKEINEAWNNKSLNFLLDNCINIENNLYLINNIKETIKKYKDICTLEVKFSPPNEYKINKILEIIKCFGKVYSNNFQYSFIKINSINYSKIGINLKEPKIGVPRVDIHGPKNDAGIDKKGFKIPGIGVDIKGPSIGKPDLNF